MPRRNRSKARLGKSAAKHALPIEEPVRADDGDGGDGDDGDDGDFGDTDTVDTDTTDTDTTDTDTGTDSEGAGGAGAVFRFTLPVLPEYPSLRSQPELPQVQESHG